MSTIKPIAIYLPQFHPIPENDAWWGKGFTEWTNVTKAKPFFEGHYQPHLPADLGFYDLRLKEARFAQEALAKEYGIYGFCYYHYWFNGKLLLEKPLEEKLKNNEEDLPFMICWANENWTKVWDGSENEVIMEQVYSEDNYRKHIEYLLPFFLDERYIKIEGRPVFAIYRTTKIPDLDNFIKTFNKALEPYNTTIYFIRFETFNEEGSKYMSNGIDAALDFQPHSAGHYYSRKLQLKNIKEIAEFKYPSISRKITNRLGITKAVPKPQPINFSNTIIKYRDLAEADLENFVEKNSYPIFPCVCVGFDNTPRKDVNYTILTENNPDDFAYWMKEKIKISNSKKNKPEFLFINAWNEWAEGNHLEPDQKWGVEFLKKVKDLD